MQKTILTAVALAAMPLAVHAQNLNGFYVGARGGASWLLDSTANISGNATVTGVGTGPFNSTTSATFQTGWAAGGFVGYDFVGPRVEIEALYRDNKGTGNAVIPVTGVGTLRVNGRVDETQTSVMANVYYDFLAHEALTPYVGAGAGIAFINRPGELVRTNDTEFAYQAIVGVGYKIAPNLRLNLDGRYYGTLNPTFSHSYNPSGFTVPVAGYVSGSYPNNNFSVLASVVYGFGPATAIH
jgi:opacity protein-like surface antigen